MKKLPNIAVTAAALALLAVGAARGQQDAERDLARVQGEIAKLERELERQIARRDDGMSELRKIELELMKTRAEQRSLEAKIREQKSRGDEIAGEQRAAAASLGREQKALADQVRMSYMTGSEELVKLLLNQDNPADFGRMLVYYDYLNRHRSERIGAVDREISRLAELAEEAERVAADLERLDAEQMSRAASLEQQQAERKALVAELDAAVESSGGRIEKMRAEEAELNEVIARLSAIIEDFPIESDEPFTAQKGKLPWPVEGRIAARYGAPRDPAGRMFWQGVLIEAPLGTPVRAVYRGRVLLSEWTAQMGLLLIIDHGEGYMTLYGHNSALLREVGDWVEAGEAVAEVGDTGGQLGTGLYFGLRRNGEPADPAPWIH